jgi:hypothetical protein
MSCHGLSVNRRMGAGLLTKDRQRVVLPANQDSSFGLITRSGNLQLSTIRRIEYVT